MYTTPQFHSLSAAWGSTFFIPPLAHSLAQSKVYIRVRTDLRSLAYRFTTLHHAWHILELQCSLLAAPRHFCTLQQRGDKDSNMRQGSPHKDSPSGF
jgi:hypothetical protein